MNKTEEVEKLRKEIERLKNYIRLAECQYLGCGGGLSPNEVINNMREILNEALK